MDRLVLLSSSDSISDIFFSVSIDGGQTFSERENLSNNLEASASAPQINSSGNNVYVVWINGSPPNTPLNLEVFFKVSHDGGETFGDIQNLSNNPGNSFDPQIATS